jgi:hypothetical protein
MKLYELERETCFTVDKDESQTVFRLQRIDGMFSICYYKMEGKDVLVHIIVNADVTIVTFH